MAIELAVVNHRRDDGGGLISFARIDSTVVVRLAYIETDRADRWLTVWTTAGPLGLAGDGATTYDGNVWVGEFSVGHQDEVLPDSVAELQAGVDGSAIQLEPCPVAKVRTLSIRSSPAASGAADGACAGCNRLSDSSYCGACTSAIEDASQRSGRSCGAPNGVIPVGVTLGTFDRGEVVLLDVEVYAEFSILRSWWTAEAADDEPLSTLRSPFDRRWIIETDAGDEFTIATGSSWSTDGRGVHTSHRIGGAVDAASRVLRISAPDPSRFDVVIDLAPRHRPRPA